LKKPSDWGSSTIRISKIRSFVWKLPKAVCFQLEVISTLLLRVMLHGTGRDPTLRLATIHFSNESRSWGLGISSRYNVFDGYSKYLNIGMKTRDIEAARLNLRRIHQEIVYRTITQYYRILNFKEILKVRKENLDWNIENQKIIQAKVDVGSGIMTDVRQQEVKVGQAELALVQAEQTLNDAKRELYYFLRLDVTDEYEFVDGVELLTKVKSDTVKGRWMV
jgi:outer membrane protein TolC